jgi:hypothetical protein
VEVPRPEFAFTVFALMDRMDIIGPSNAGVLRRFPIRSGTVEGPGIRGELLPGGADWQTLRPDGGLLLEAKYSFRTDDGVLVQVYNRGLAWLPGATSWPGPHPPTRTSAQFIAPDGKYDWLNRYVFVSSIDVPPEPIDRVWIHFFKLL